MEKRNRVETILDSIATATPVTDPRDRLEVIASAIASAFGGTEVGAIKTRDRVELLLLAIAKAISESGVVIIEPLSVTENGTYTATEGTAYSPVTVNVPLPENAYLLKTATAGDTVTFTDGAAAPLYSLKANITAVQEGTGTQSPTNVRDFVGWSNAVITANSSTITVQLGSTVYDGVIDFGSGIITVTHALVAMKDLTWSRVYGIDHIFTATINDKAGGRHNFECSCYAQDSTDTGYGDIDDLYCVGRITSPNGAIYVRDDTYSSGADFYDSLEDDDTIKYELETPTTITLTPTLVSSISGSNSIAVNCGSITECKYFS